MSALACGCDPDCRPKPYYREDCPDHGEGKTSEEQDAATLQRNKTRDLAALGEAFRDVREGRSMFDVGRLKPGPGFGTGKASEVFESVGVDLAAGRDFSVIRCVPCGFECDTVEQMVAHLRGHGFRSIYFSGRQGE